MRRILGIILALVGSWMLISPQALLGLAELKWMYKYAFPGEVLIGIVVISIGFYLIGFKAPKVGKPSH
ncbi:MAG: hypothetical protein ABSD88_12225 [Candidatus Korobacteraceae bacterium]